MIPIDVKLTFIFGPMISLQFPKPAFRVQTKNGLHYIFDSIRKKWLLLRDEEWVRQNIVQYLLLVKHYPKAFIALEKEIQLGKLNKRFDILVFDRAHNPWLLIECKGNTIILNNDTLHQVLRYSIPMPAQYMFITNGGITYGWEKVNNALVEIDSFPKFPTHD